MSIWTHVAGIIRIDDTRFDGSNVKEIKKLVEENLPCGTEGPLEFEIYESPEHSSIAAYVVSIFGDLRDFDSSSDVIDWFKGVCYKVEEMKSDDMIFIRQATITSRTEGCKSENWTFVSEYEKETTPAKTTPTESYFSRHYELEKEVLAKICNILGDNEENLEDWNYTVLVQEHISGEQFTAQLESVSGSSFTADGKTYRLSDMNLDDLCIVLDHLLSGK